MTTPKIAFIKARWHSDIVDRAHAGFTEHLPGLMAAEVDAFDVPGAYEIPLLAKRLAATYDAVVGCAFVVDGGIYRHDFVASTVVDALMRAQMEADTPMFSVVLTPHNYQETEVHNAFFAEHFVKKGREAAEAVAATLALHQAAVAA